jgi:surfactin synthase thioesterase subunit
VYAYAGIDDAIATPALMQHWSDFTSSTFSMRSFAGGHFFARSAKDFLVGLAQDLETCQGAHSHAAPAQA